MLLFLINTFRDDVSHLVGWWNHFSNFTPRYSEAELWHLQLVRERESETLMLPWEIITAPRSGLSERHNKRHLSPLKDVGWACGGQDGSSLNSLSVTALEVVEATT